MTDDVAQRIVSDLEQKIFQGELVAGARLAEVALSELYKVSRAPVRVALQRLEQMGLVTLRPHVGARVRVFEQTEIHALYELRIALESEAARLAALRINEDGKQALQAILVQHQVAMKQAGTQRYARQKDDTDFHYLIASLSQSTFILQTLSAELYPQFMLLRQQHQNVQGRGKKALYEHHNIAAAIKEHDAELAALLMRRHLQASLASLIGQLPSI